MTDPVSIIIPARDEAQTIARVVGVLGEIDDVDEIVVIDNGSTDATAEEARGAGATVISETRKGMGHAVRAGIRAARHDWVMKVDADLDRFDTRLFARMPAARGSGVGLVKGAWNDPDDNMPMTRLLVAPALRQMFPGLGHLRAPNSGLYLFDRSRIAHEKLTGDYAVDIDVMVRVHAAGLRVAEVDIGRIAHDMRNVQHYNGMAEEIFAFFLSRQSRHITDQMVVVARDGVEVIRHALAALVHRLSAGVQATIYLERFDSDDTRLLETHLRGYPTARILPLCEAKMFAPHGNATGLCVLAPYPRAGGSEALSVAVMLHETERAQLGGDLWLMPTHEPGRDVSGFTPDMIPDVSDGLAAKQQALAALGGADAGSGREVFQSYATLPDALRPRDGRDLSQHAPSAGNF